MRITLPLAILACGLAACTDKPVTAPVPAPQLSKVEAQRVPFRIESWLHRQVGGNPLVTGDVTSCAKVWIGDQLYLSGEPTWTDADYATPGSTPAEFAAKCANASWLPVGGYRMEGQGRFQGDNGTRLDNVLWARHTIPLPGGSFEIQFEGRYDPTFHCFCSAWVIKGGTGDFAGLQGNGDCEAQGRIVDFGTGDPSTWDIYFVHTETGSVHWTGK